MAVACGKVKQEKELEMIEIQSSNYEAKGDSTVYGLACSGSTDSVLVFLPDAGGDPIELNVFNAKKANLMFGHPEVGDRMALLLSPQDSTEVRVAIDVDQLRGTWTFMQMPKISMPGSSAEIDSIRRTMTPEERERVDSLVRSFMVPREYGYTFKRDFTMMPVGGPPRVTSLDENVPVEYPPLKRYTEWHIYNGKIIFSHSMMNGEGANNDTANFVFLHPDTMAIQFGDSIRGFRLTPDTIK